MSLEVTKLSLQYYFDVHRRMYRIYFCISRKNLEEILDKVEVRNSVADRTEQSRAILDKDEIPMLVDCPYKVGELEINHRRRDNGTWKSDFMEKTIFCKEGSTMKKLFFHGHLILVVKHIAQFMSSSRDPLLR